MHIPAAMDDEWTLELYCKTHKCTAVANPKAGPPLQWMPKWDMFVVNTEAIFCPKKDEFNGECWFMMLTDANRYLHGTHCRGVVLCSRCQDS